MLSLNIHIQTPKGDSNSVSAWKSVLGSLVLTAIPLSQAHKNSCLYMLFPCPQHSSTLTQCPQCYQTRLSKWQWDDVTFLLEVLRDSPGLGRTIDNSLTWRKSSLHMGLPSLPRCYIYKKPWRCVMLQGFTLRAPFTWNVVPILLHIFINPSHLINSLSDYRIPGWTFFSHQNFEGVAPKSSPF